MHSSFNSCTVTSLALRGWQGNGLRPPSGNHVPGHHTGSMGDVFKSNELRTGSKQRRKINCPAVETGRGGKRGTVGFHIFKVNYELTSASV